MVDATKITSNKGSPEQKPAKAEKMDLAAMLDEVLAKLSNKPQKKAWLKALLLRFGKNYPILDSEDMSEEHSKKVAELFLEFSKHRDLMQIQCLLTTASKCGLKDALGPDGKSIKFSDQDTIFFPKPGTNLNPPTMGDLLHLEKGVVKSYQIFKSKLGCSIDPETMKAEAKFVSTSKEKGGVLDKLKAFLEKYRKTNVDGDKIDASKGAADLAKGLGEDKAVIVELVPDGKGGFKPDLKGLGEGVVKIAHIGENGKPNGEFDVLVLDKNGKIIDGMITDGSKLGVETREELRKAIFEKETKMPIKS